MNEFTRQSLELDVAGQKLPATLDRPAGGGKRPGVVIAPGGLSQGDVEAYRWAAEPLVAAGFVALTVTYRAASPYEDAADVLLGVDALSRDEGVDAGRLYAFGHSRGGLPALRAAATDPRIKGVISIATPSDITGYVGALGGYFPQARDSIVEFMGGAPGDIPDKYASVHGLTLASQLHCPVLLVHGTADMRVPVTQSVLMANALRESGNANVTLELLPNVGHFLELGTYGYQFAQVMALTTAWLQKLA